MEQITYTGCLLEKNIALNDQDRADIDLCQQGNLDAFESLVGRYQKKMFNIAYRMTGSHEDASEIVQEAFVSAFRNIHKFERRARFSTWITTIVINLGRNHLKKFMRRSRREGVSFHQARPGDGEMEVEFTSAEESCLERIEKKEIQRMVQLCIDSLEREHKEIIVLRDIEGFSYEEIEKVLGIPAGTVKSRLFRARASLKNCLKHYVGEL